jgi:hypothetical protein
MDVYVSDEETDDNSVEIDNLDIDNLVYKWKPTPELLDIVSQ